MSFPMVALGKVVLPVERAEVPGAGTTYRQVGVKLWGVGAYERESMDGSQTRYKTLSRVEEDDIIVNKIWARNGSVALVPKSLAGCYVSGEFPTFIPIREKLEPRWFHWLTKTKGFWEKCDEKSQGTSGKNRIRPERFLEIEIPLPPLSEQRRIVARIEELAAKIEEARGLRRQGGEEIKIIIASVLGKMFNKGKENRFKYRLIRDSITEHKQGYYNSSKFLEGDVFFARITDITNDAYLNYAGMPRITIDDETLESFRVQPNDFLFARTGGAGRFAIATEELKCVFASYLIRFRFKPDYRPEFLRYYFWSPRFQEEISSSIHGGANQNIHAEDIKEATIPIISETEQHRFVAYLDTLQVKVDALRRLQAETGAELDALLPAVLDRAFKGEL